MARYELRAGAEIDLLTADEMRDALSDTMGKLGDALAAAQPSPELVRHEVATGTTDASGNIGGGLAGDGWPVYAVPVGMRAFVHRFLFQVASATPTSPLTTGQVLVCRNRPTPTAVEMFLPVSGVVAPVLVTEGRDTAVQLLSGEKLILAAASLPTATAWSVNMQIRLYPASDALARP